MIDYYVYHKSKLNRRLKESAKWRVGIRWLTCTNDAVLDSDTLRCTDMDTIGIRAKGRSNHFEIGGKNAETICERNMHLLTVNYQ